MSTAIVCGLSVYCAITYLAGWEMWIGHKEKLNAGSIASFILSPISVPTMFLIIATIYN